MSDEIRAISGSHLAVEEAMESLISVARRIRQEEDVNKRDRKDLLRQTGQLAEALEEHVEMGHSRVDEVSKAILGERPCEVEDLDAGSKRFLRQVHELQTLVKTLKPGESVHSPPWQQFETLLQQSVETLDRCSDQEWDFYTRYGSVLFPAGTASE